MSDVIDTSVVPDDELVTIHNMTNSSVAYHVDSLGNLRRELPPKMGASIRVPAGELRQLNYELGGSVLLHDYICVENEALAREFGITSDDKEYTWGMKDVKAALTTDDIAVLEDAMDFAPDGIKETLAQEAVNMEIPDSNRRRVISDATSYDIDTMIKNKQAIAKDAPATEKKAATASRGTSTKKRRVATA